MPRDSWLRLTQNFGELRDCELRFSQQRKYARVKFYTVKSGDNLTTIANTTGIPIATLESLNPRIDPNSLQTGQRLRLRR